MLRLRYNLVAELRTNRGIYDLAKMAKYATAFSHGRARGMRPLIDDPYMVFAAEWMAERLDCQVVMLVRHPAGHRLEPRPDRHRLERQPARHRLAARARPRLPRAVRRGARARGPRAARPDRARRASVARHPCGIAHQVARNPRFVVVRYEDLAGDPLNEFRALYDRLDGVTFNRSAEATVRSGCLAGPAQRNVPLGQGRARQDGVPAHAEPG